MDKPTEQAWQDVMTRLNAQLNNRGKNIVLECLQFGGNHEFWSKFPNSDEIETYFRNCYKFAIDKVTGETYDDRPGSYSSDGTKRYELKTLDKIFVLALFGVVFAAEYKGEKEKPQIHLFDPKTNEDYITFTYWGDNVLHLTWDIDDDREKHLQLIGEFTSK